MEGQTAFPFLTDQFIPYPAELIKVMEFKVSQIRGGRVFFSDVRIGDFQNLKWGFKAGKFLLVPAPLLVTPFDKIQPFPLDPAI